METLEEKIALKAELDNEIKSLGENISELRRLQIATKERRDELAKEISLANYPYPIGTKVEVRYKTGMLFGQEPEEHTETVFIAEPQFDWYKDDYHIAFKKCKKDGTISLRDAYIQSGSIIDIKKVED